MSAGASDDETLRGAAQALPAGDAALAEQLATRLLQHPAAPTQARIVRANARLTLGHWRDAAADLDVLLAAQPQAGQLQRLLALCWLRIGNAHQAAGEIDDAAAAWRRAIAAAPGVQDARHNLGALLLAHDRAADALPLLRSVVAAEPGNALAVLDLARTEVACGHAADATARTQALAANASDSGVLQACATLLLDAGDIDAAARVLARIVATAPERWPWLLAQARRLRENAAPQASHVLLEQLAQAPLPPVAHLCRDLHAALGLPSVYADDAQIDAARAGFATGLAQLIEAHPPQRMGDLGADADALCWDNFLLAYQGRDDRELQVRFGTWYGALLAAAVPLAAPAAATARPRPRIALVSGRWHHCTVGVYFGAWIEALSLRGWQVILVHAGAFRDAWTERLAQSAHAELTLTGPLADSARRLRELDADIVLYPELGMDSTVFALAALRLARCQVCAWGHPDTTGLPTIDAFVSCADMEPDAAQRHYSERLLLLPGLGTRYPAPEMPAPGARAELGLPDARPLYFVPQSAFKLHPHNDDVLARIVARDADALLVLFADRQAGATQRLRERLLRRLAALSAQPERHLLLLAQRSREEFLRVTRACDVMVDSVHWSGGNTTLDALHCGLPVVTLPGPLMRGRQSAAMLRALGRDDLVTGSLDALADTAVVIAHDRGRREAFSHDVAQNLPALTQSDAPLAALDAQLRQLLHAR
jgi:CRISPR-associated protein Csy1